MTEEPAATRRLTGPPVSISFIIPISFNSSDSFDFLYFRRISRKSSVPKKDTARADSFFASLCFRFPGAFLAVGKRPPAPPNGSFPDRYRLLC